jgi:hypothetical protein
MLHCEIVIFGLGKRRPGGAWDWSHAAQPIAVLVQQALSQA